MIVNIIYPKDNTITANDIMGHIEIDYSNQILNAGNAEKYSMVHEYYFPWSKNYRAFLLSNGFIYNPLECGDELTLTIIAPDIENGRRLATTLCLPNFVQKYPIELENNLADFWDMEEHDATSEQYQSSMEILKKFDSGKNILEHISLESFEIQGNVRPVYTRQDFWRKLWKSKLGDIDPAANLHSRISENIISD